MRYRSRLYLNRIPLPKNREFVMSRLFRVGVVIAILMGVLSFSVVSKASAASSPHSSTLHAAATSYGVPPKASNSSGKIHPQLPNQSFCHDLYWLWMDYALLYGFDDPVALDLKGWYEYDCV